MTNPRRNPSEGGKWAPLQQLDALRDEIQRLIDVPLAALRGTDGQPLLSGWCPAVDIYEDHQNLHLRAELPGMKKEDIQISLHQDLLSLSGERRFQPGDPAATTYRSERVFGRFHRTVALPMPVQADKIKANYRDGILSITLPKADEARPRQIQVKIQG